MNINLETDKWYCKYKNHKEFLMIKLTLEAIYKNKFKYMKFVYNSHNIFYNANSSYATMSKSSQKFNNLYLYDNFQEVTLDYILKYNPVG